MFALSFLVSFLFFVQQHYITPNFLDSCDDITTSFMSQITRQDETKVRATASSRKVSPSEVVVDEVVSFCVLRLFLIPCPSFVKKSFMWSWLTYSYFFFSSESRAVSQMTLMRQRNERSWHEKWERIIFFPAIMSLVQESNDVIRFISGLENSGRWLPPHPLAVSVRCSLDSCICHSWDPSCQSSWKLRSRRKDLLSQGRLC
jgi:hypothetical protein